MGFFSQDCKGCGHSVRAPAAVRKPSQWMNEVVVLEPDGNKYVGNYDGYGGVERVGKASVEVIGGRNEVWHRTCWHLAGKPKFTEESSDSNDQGIFVGEYDPEEPRTMEDVTALLRVREAQRAARKAEYAAYRAAHPQPQP